MNSPCTSPEIPEWKRFLCLGERLLELDTTSQRCQAVCDEIHKQLGCQARIWLSPSFYPLPGEPPCDLFPLPAETPGPVTQACINLEPALEPDRSAAAFPLVAGPNLLGVVYIWDCPATRFSPPSLTYLEGVVAHAALYLEMARQAAIKNWRNEQLSLVQSVSRQIVSVFDMDELCRRVVQLVQETFNYYYVALFTLEKDSPDLHFRANASTSGIPLDQPAFNPPAGRGIIGSVAASGEERVAQDVLQDPQYLSMAALPETRSEAAFPLRSEGRLLGVLDVQGDAPNAFHETDILVLRSLADAVSMALENARLYHSLQRRAEEIATVSEFSRALTSILDLEQLFDEIVHLIQRHYQFPHVHVFTVHPGRRKVIFEAGSGQRSSTMRDQQVQYELDSPRGIIPWVARSGRTVLVNDTSIDALYIPSPFPPYNTAAELAVPLKAGEEVLGVLDIQADSPGAFRASDVRLFEALAASMAVAVRNATLYRSERWRSQVADSFRDVAAQVSSNVALEELLDSILMELERSLPCDASALWLLSEKPNPECDGDSLYLAAAHCVESDRIESALCDSEATRGFLELVLLEPEPNIRRPEDPLGPLGMALGFPADYSSIAAPLRAGDKSLGILALAHHTPGRYGSEARALTSTFASYAAVAIQNAKLFSQATEQAWVSTVLLQVAEASQAIEDVQELLNTMVRLPPLLVGVKKCAFFLWDEKSAGFELKSSYGLEGLESGRLFPESAAPALAQLRSRRAPVFIEDAARELSLPAELLPPDSGTLVVLPILLRGAVLGAFLVAYQPAAEMGVRQPFNDQFLSILQGIVHQTAVAMENLRLLEAQQEEAYITAVLLQVAQAVVSQNELDDILDTIVHLMPILVGIETCAVYLWNGDQKVFQTAKAYARTRTVETVMENRTYSQGEFNLLDLVLENNHAYFAPLRNPALSFESWAELNAFSEEELSSVFSLSGDWLMGFPLAVKGEALGVLLAREAGADPAFQARRMELLNGVAQQVALAVQNENINRERVERQRVESEIQLARQIQETFLPNHMPRIAGWEVDARWQTARQVGGDFYDIFRLGKERLALVIADVSDKGIPAALYMTVARTLVRANAQHRSSPAEVLQTVNQLLATDAQNGMFVTAAYAILNTRSGELVYASAGHNRPILMHSGSGESLPLPKGGMALGILDEIHLQDHILTLDPGDALVMYTDGVTEAFSPQGEAFGENGLISVMKNCRGCGINDMLTTLDQELVKFRGGLPPSDDVTLLGLRRC